MHDYRKRFTFHEGYRWSYEDENIFIERCLKNPRWNYPFDAFDEIYHFYSENYADWKLKRYYTNSMRLLDHAYHCMIRGTAKEMLYKAGLDELAVNIEDLDEINLLARKPSEIYDGVSVRALRAMNCRDGSILLSTAENRAFIKELQMKFPGIFNEALNDAQCRYLNYLIGGKLTVGEAGRLFQTRRLKLMQIWNTSQYKVFQWKEKMNKEAINDAEKIGRIDPIYKRYMDKINFNDIDEVDQDFQTLRYYLLRQREQYDMQVRRSNRKRNQNWQERDNGYVIRYPQTINDFCREAIYMYNCLLTFVDFYINNETTILFMRKEDDYNTPFITIEIFENELMQAYRRFNQDCSKEEAEWIRSYCDRNGIGHDKFKFVKSLDEVF